MKLQHWKTRRYKQNWPYEDQSHKVKATTFKEKAKATTLKAKTKVKASSHWLQVNAKTKMKAKA